jgi:hypothetical protein
MSTKQSIFYGDDFHLYQDVLDVGPRPFYLEISNTWFECVADETSSMVTLKIPEHIAKVIGLAQGKGASHERAI